MKSRTVGNTGPAGAIRRAGLLLASLIATGSGMAFAAKGGALRTDGKSVFVHRITLYDHNAEAIKPRDPKAKPYSPAVTCGKCHGVDQIQKGWHFNAADPEVEKGRPGEPWMLVDKETGTQIPVSSRGWPGTYKPEDVGLSSWEFVKTFGHHYPGGGLGWTYKDANEKLKDENAKWSASGNLEIDCLLCHSRDNRHDPDEQWRQIEKNNFKYSPSAASGIGAITGSVKDLPPPDPLAELDPDYKGPDGLSVRYDPSRFDVNDRAFVDVTRSPDTNRCYYCHSTRPVGPGAKPRWQRQQDVHIAAGFKCTDCHKNGIDHRVTRGYEGEPRPKGERAHAGLSCRSSVTSFS